DDLFRQSVIKRFYSPKLRSFGTLMIYLQSPTTYLYGRPDVLLCQTVADFPAFSQKLDRAIVFHLAYEMHPPLGDRQYRPYVPNRLFAQPSWLDPTSRLRDCSTPKRRRRVFVSIPVQEQRLLFEHFAQVCKVVALPEMSHPQAVDTFYHPIAFGFSGRQEQDFYPDIQAQPHDRAKTTRGS